MITPTSGPPSQDGLPHMVIHKDEQGKTERHKPPLKPTQRKRIPYHVHVPMVEHLIHTLIEEKMHKRDGEGEEKGWAWCERLTLTSIPSSGPHRAAWGNRPRSRLGKSHSATQRQSKGYCGRRNNELTSKLVFLWQIFFNFLTVHVHVSDSYNQCSTTVLNV